MAYARKCNQTISIKSNFSDSLKESITLTYFYTCSTLKYHLRNISSQRLKILNIILKICFQKMWVTIVICYEYFSKEIMTQNKSGKTNIILFNYEIRLKYLIFKQNLILLYHFIWQTYCILREGNDHENDKKRHRLFW